MSERLSTCDTWHPRTPTRMSVQKNGRRKNGVPVIKEVCIECVRVKTQIHRDGLCLREPYGVLPRLTWPAPEFMT